MAAFPSPLLVIHLPNTCSASPRAQFASKLTPQITHLQTTPSVLYTTGIIQLLVLRGVHIQDPITLQHLHPGDSITPKILSFLISSAEAQGGWASLPGGGANLRALQPLGGGGSRGCLH